MSLADFGIEGYESKTLLLDGDIIIYQPCCIFNEDDDQSKRMIMKNINQKIEKLMAAADCDKYIMFVTTKTNFRDFLVDDYKANREDVDRPVNLAWAKRRCVETLNNHYHQYLEADDLLGIYAGDDTVTWSLDKDIRQIPGNHLDDATGEIVTVTEQGVLRERVIVSKNTGKKKKKVYFDGTIGLYYQLLIGDNADNILGCAERVNAVRKSGKDAGQSYIKRQGVGSSQAIKLLTSAALYRGDDSILRSAQKAVAREYHKIHGKNWKSALETQANLLFMVREQHGDIIKRWTYDNRDEYMDITTGEIVHDFEPNKTSSD